MKKICLIVASSGKNLTLAQDIEAVLKNKGMQTSVLNLVDMDLPLYTTTAELKYSAIELIRPYLEYFKASGYVFVTPEYNGAPAPAFSNFLAWVSRSTKNWRETFNGHPAMLASFSAGNGVQTILMMRIQLAHIGMNVLGRTIHSTNHRTHTEQEIIDSCDALIKTLTF